MKSTDHTDTVETDAAEPTGRSAVAVKDRDSGVPEAKDRETTEKAVDDSDSDPDSARPSAEGGRDQGPPPAMPTDSSGGGFVTPGRIGVALLSLFAIAATVAAIVLGVVVKNNADTDAAGQEALRTARDYAVALTSIDTAELDEDFARVLDGATGEFKDMYSSSSSQLRQLLVDNQAAGKGTVVDAAIKSQSQDRVEVLLFVDQTVTNTAMPDPRLDRSRIQMTMEKVDGRWLASEVSLP